DRTFALTARPAEHTMIPILRELWFDRLALLVLALVCAVPAFALGGLRAGEIALGAVVAVVVLYELATPKPDLRTYDSARPEVRQLFEIPGARAICLGHTHRPFGHWDGGPEPRFYGNSGSWCPAFHDQHCTRPVLSRRPLLLLTSEGDALWGGLHWWDGEA